MISTRRVVAAAALAAGVTGLAAPMANAADADAHTAGKLNPIAVLDSAAASEIPAEQRGNLPKVSEQLHALGRVHEVERLNELHQLTDLAAPVTGLLPGVDV